MRHPSFQLEDIGHKVIFLWIRKLFCHFSLPENNLSRRYCRHYYRQRPNGYVTAVTKHFLENV